MDGVERSCLLLGHVDHLQADDLEPLAFQPTGYLTDVAALHRVGLDDNERPFVGSSHSLVSSLSSVV